MGKFFRFKVLLIGPAEVGKTSLLMKYVKDFFAEDYMSTIGAQFLSKDVNFKKDIVNLQIWDMGGQKQFKFLHKQFYSGSDGSFLIFDLTRSNTYEEMHEWLSEMYEILGEEIPFILIGNKVDLIEKTGRKMDVERARAFAESKNSIYIETSAKTGEKVEDAFRELTLRIADAKGKKLK